MRNRHKTLGVVLNILGALLLSLSIFLLLPILVAVLYKEIQNDLRIMYAFVVPAALSCTISIILRAICRSDNPNNLQAMLSCSIGWLAFSAIGAIPFVIGIGASYVDGFFEAMSGFTTTGITMFTGLDEMPRSILFWRSLTQWIGGLGILTFFLTVTYHGGGAHRLFGAESHKIGMERPVPSLANTLRILWGIYAGFTAIIIIGLVLARMSLFDSICHSFTALSTGGYSPHDSSIEYYKINGFAHFRLIEYILIVGMLMGGMNFLIHYRLFKRQPKALLDNTEMRYWWSLIAIFVASIFIERFLKVDPPTSAAYANGFWGRIEESFRSVLFQVVSILTTTGFGTRDIGGPYFGQVARQLFLVMMVIGGCVGSTGGGLKVLRFSILVKLIKREVFRLRTSPRAISTIYIDGKNIEPNEVYRVGALFFTWIFLIVIGGFITAFLSELGAYESFSGMCSAIGNIGPCYISVSDMGQLNPAIKIVYIFGMLAGRLEILPVILIFSRRAWQS